MTSRERVYTTLKEKKPADKVLWSFNFGATQGFNPNLLLQYKRKHQIRKPICEHFDYDIITVLDPDRVHPIDIDGNTDGKIGIEALVGGVGFISNGIDPAEYFQMDTLPKGGYFDPWGIYHYPWSLDPTFEVYIGPFQGKEDIRELPQYPSPKVDWESIKRAKADIEAIRKSGKASVCYAGSVYEWSHYIRGLEGLMVDMYTDPQAVHLLFNKVGDFVLELSAALQDIDVDILAFYDDFGQQDRLQISPAFWRTFVKPVWKRIWAETKRRNKETIIFLHSCGCIEEIIGDLEEIGLDVLHPLQPETMDVYEVAGRHHGDLALWGTVSAQQTIPFGTPDDLTGEIKERVERIGKNGAFVVSPANIMGPEVPLENIDAFANACETYCKL
jgi:uroporphyrinogen decarboxylase